MQHRKTVRPVPSRYSHGFTPDSINMRRVFFSFSSERMEDMLTSGAIPTYITENRLTKKLSGIPSMETVFSITAAIMGNSRNCSNISLFFIVSFSCFSKITLIFFIVLNLLPSAP